MQKREYITFSREGCALLGEVRAYLLGGSWSLGPHWASVRIKIALKSLGLGTCKFGHLSGAPVPLFIKQSSSYAASCSRGRSALPSIEAPPFQRRECPSQCISRQLDIRALAW
jgi:hypothetical protein